MNKSTKKNKVLAVIPARYQSTRFEGKPLALILGKPMIYHVYTNASKSKLLDEVIVATDDQRIFDTVKNFGGKVVMTSKNHLTGTDRVAEAASYSEADIVVNVQGDEPLVNVEVIEDLVKPLLSDPGVQVSNVITKINHPGDFIDTTIVKATIDLQGNLLFLTRAPVPYPKTRQNYVVYQHIGLYAFRKKLLLEFAKMKPTPLELIEGVEFLRLLEHGYKVKAVETSHRSIGVDTLSDLIEVEKIMKKSKPH